MGIVGIKPMNKLNEELRIIRAVCRDEVAMKKLINDGVKLDYCHYKAEEYKKPIRPMQCFKCQQFDHVAINCKEDTICQKCAGNYLKKDCLSDKENCANCGEEHNSSFHQCVIYKQKLEAKLSKINSKQESIRTYSQAVSKNDSELELKLKSTIIDSLKEALKDTEKALKTEITSLKNEIGSKIERVQNDLNLYKAKELFIELDDYEILYNKKLTTEQIKKMVNTRKNHGIEVNLQSILNYNTRKPVNKDEYLNVQYV